MSTTSIRTEASESKRFRAYAWRYLFFFSLLYCCMYCGKLNLANASASLIEELSFTKTDIGVITGALFWGYGIGQLVNGRASELIGAKRFLVASALLTFTMNMAMCLTTSLALMGFIWGLNGFAQSMAWTPGVSLLTNWWHARRRGFAVGFAVAFAGFGQVLVTLVVALAFLLFPSAGYKAAFLFPAAFPLVALTFFLLFAKATPAEASLTAYSESDSKQLEREAAMRRIVEEKGVLYPYKYILTTSGFPLWAFISFAMGIARYGLITWIPLFMIDAFGTNLAMGLVQSAALPLGMSLGTLFVPTLTDRFCPGNRLPAAIVSAFGAALSLALLAFVEKSSANLLVVELLLFLTGFFVHAINGTVTTYATDLGGRVFTATTLGTLDFTHYAGALTQSLLFGVLLEGARWEVLFASIAFTTLFCAFLGLCHSRRQLKPHKPRL